MKVRFYVDVPEYNPNPEYLVAYSTPTGDPLNGDTRYSFDVDIPLHDSIHLGETEMAIKAGTEDDTN